MALKDRTHADFMRVFFNEDQFGERHTWNGVPFVCVTDDETALKRKNNNVVDVSWDNNTEETVVYAQVEGFPGRVVPNEEIYFDGRHMRILQAQQDVGMYTILLVDNVTKAVGIQ